MYKRCSACQERTSSSRIIPLDICALWCQISYGRTITERLSRCWCWRSRGWELIGYGKGRTCRFATILHGFDYISARLGDPIDTTIGSHRSTHWSSCFSDNETYSYIIHNTVSHFSSTYRTTARCLILVNCGLGRSGVGFYHYDVTQGLPATRIFYLYIIVLDTICIGWRYKGRATTFWSTVIGIGSTFVPLIRESTCHAMVIGHHGKSGNGSSTCTIRIGRSCRLSGDTWCWLYSEFHLLGGLTAIGTFYLKFVFELCCGCQLSSCIVEGRKCCIGCR